MKILRKAKVGNVLKNYASRKSKRQKNVSESQFKLFLEVEKETSSGMRQISLMAFAVITGAIAALLRTPDESLAVKGCLLGIFGLCVFVSLLFFLAYLNYYKKSVDIFNDRQKFIAKRKAALSMLLYIVFIIICFFELCFIIFIFDAAFKPDYNLFINHIKCILTNIYTCLMQILECILTHIYTCLMQILKGNK